MKKEYILKQIEQHDLNPSNGLVQSMIENCLYLDRKEEIKDYINDCLDLYGSKLFH